MKVTNAATIAVATVIWFFVVVSGTNESNAVLRRRDTTDERNLQTTDGVVTKLVLINARTNTPITDLVNGQIIKFATLFGSSAPELNINAIVSGSISSVRFGFDNNPRFRNEAAAPYAFCGDTQRKFDVCPQLGYGTYTVTATPITNLVKGVPMKVTFTIVGNSAPALPPVNVPEPNFTGLRLMYTNSYPTVFVMNLQFGALNVIDLQKLNLQADDFNIEALVGSNVKSVLFSNGHGETSKPLAYCGNFGDNFHTCEDLKLGTAMKISITAYSETYQRGTVIATRETTIQIVRSSSPIAPVAAPVRVPVPVTPPIAPVPGCPLPKVCIKIRPPL